MKYLVAWVDESSDLYSRVFDSDEEADEFMDSEFMENQPAIKHEVGSVGKVTDRT